MCTLWNKVQEVVTATAAVSLQSCPTLCEPIDGSPPDSSVPGILQARTLEWVAISFSNSGTWKVKVKSLSYVRLSATPWSAAYHAPPSLGFSRQEYWSGVPSPSPRSLLGVCFIYSSAYVNPNLPVYPSPAFPPDTIYHVFFCCCC